MQLVYYFSEIDYESNHHYMYMQTRIMHAHAGATSTRCATSLGQSLST